MKISIKSMPYIVNSTFVTAFPFLFLAGLIGFAGFSDICFAKGKKKGAAKSFYGDSFSKPGTVGLDTSEMAPVSHSVAPSLNSFPVRVQVEDSDVNGWKQPDTIAMPNRISKAFKIGNCQFEIKGGDYSVRQYNGENNDNLYVLADAVAPQSTFSAALNGQAFFSLVTSLSVSIDDKNKSTCKDAIGKKMLYIGRASLEGSSLHGVSEGGDAVNAAVFKQESPGKLFVSWNNDAKQIVIADSLGMVPEVESSVFALTFDEKETYYLGFDYAFTLTKDKEKVAKK